MRCFECKCCLVRSISWDITYNSEASVKKKSHFISHHLLRQKKINQYMKKKQNANVGLERPHSCIKGRSSVRWCNGNVQIVSNLEALRLQCQGIICTFSARHSTANVFQSAKSDQTHENISSTNADLLKSIQFYFCILPTCTSSLWGQGKQC